MLRPGLGDERQKTRERLRARLALALLAGLVIACVVVDSKPYLPVSTVASRGDFDLYRRVVERVGGGESYYAVAHEELRSRGFPTRSVLNWRTPCYAWFLGRLTGPQGGRWLLTIGMLVTAVLALRDLYDDFEPLPATIGGLFLAGALAWSLGGEAFLLMEFWAGMLIVLSACALRRGFTTVGVVAGLLALFYRELALPYVLVSAGLSLHAGRKRETALWAIGLLAFALFMFAHACSVFAQINESDRTLAGGWVRFGGLGFVLETARLNVFLVVLPHWATAIYLPFAVCGFLGGRGEPGLRMGLTTALYLAAFSVVGNPFNFYWGFLTAPLLAFGIAGAPRALTGLLTASFSDLALSRPEPTSHLQRNARSSL